MDVIKQILYLANTKFSEEEPGLALFYATSQILDEYAVNQKEIDLKLVEFYNQALDKPFDDAVNLDKFNIFFADLLYKVNLLKKDSSQKLQCSLSHDKIKKVLYANLPDGKILKCISYYDHPCYYNADIIDNFLKQHPTAEFTEIGNIQTLFSEETLFSSKEIGECALKLGITNPLIHQPQDYKNINFQVSNIKTGPNFEKAKKSIKKNKFVIPQEFDLSSQIEYKEIYDEHDLKINLKSVVEGSYLKMPSLKSNLNNILYLLINLADIEYKNENIERAITLYAGVNSALEKFAPNYEQSLKLVSKIKDCMNKLFNGSAVLYDMVKEQKAFLINERYQSRKSTIYLQHYFNSNYDIIKHLSKNVEEILKNDCKKFKELQKNIYERCLSFFGENNTESYCYASLGSVSRNEGTLFSDIENIILIKEQKDYDLYFKAAKLMNLCVIALGETPIPISWYDINLDEIINPGVCSDLGGKYSLGREHKDASLSYTLVRTVENMINLLDADAEEKYRKVDPQLCHELTDATYVCGNEELLKKYHRLINKKIPDGLRQRRALSELFEDLLKFDPTYNPHKFGSKLDVKKEYYRIFNLPLARIAKYYAHEPKSSWKSLVHLQINQENLWAIEKSIAIVNLSRLLVYHQKGHQNGFIYLSSNNPYIKDRMPITDALYDLIDNTAYVWNEIAKFFLHEGSFPKEKITSEFSNKNAYMQNPSLNNKSAFNDVLSWIHSISIKYPNEAEREYKKLLSNPNLNYYRKNIIIIQYTNFLNSRLSSLEVMEFLEGIIKQGFKVYSKFFASFLYNALAIAADNLGDIEQALRYSDLALENSDDEYNKLLIKSNFLHIKYDDIHDIMSIRIKKLQAVILKYGPWHVEVANTYYWIFSDSYQTYNTEKLKKFLKIAFEIYKFADDKQSVIRCKAQYIKIHLKSNKKDSFEEATVYYNDLKNLTEQELIDIKDYTICSSMIDYCLKSQEESKKINYYLEIAKKMLAATGKIVGSYRCEVFKVYCYRISAHQDETEKLLSEGLDLFDTFKNEQPKAELKWRIADLCLGLYINSKNALYLEKAKEHIAYAKKYYDNNKFPETLQEIIKLSNEINKHLKEASNPEQKTVDNKENKLSEINKLKNEIDLNGAIYTEEAQTKLFDMLLCSLYYKDKIDMEDKKYFDKFNESASKHGEQGAQDNRTSTLQASYYLLYNQVDDFKDKFVELSHKSLNEYSMLEFCLHIKNVLLIHKESKKLSDILSYFDLTEKVSGDFNFICLGLKALSLRIYNKVKKECINKFLNILDKTPTHFQKSFAINIFLPSNNLHEKKELQRLVGKVRKTSESWGKYKL